MSALARFRDWWHGGSPAPRPAVPAPPCGAMSRKLGATVDDLRRMGFLDRTEPGAGEHAAGPPKPWRRVCVCALGHDGAWHRSEDGQVWHDTDSVTLEEVAAEEAEERRRFEAMTGVVGCQGRGVMNNAQLRMSAPVWSDTRDDGGMFSCTLSVHEDPDGGPLPFLAVCRDGWGGGAQARRASIDDARRYAEVLYERKVAS